MVNKGCDTKEIKSANLSFEYTHEIATVWKRAITRSGNDTL